MLRNVKLQNKIRIVCYYYLIKNVFAVVNSNFPKIGRNEKKKSMSVSETLCKSLNILEDAMKKDTPSTTKLKRFRSISFHNPPEHERQKENRIILRVMNLDLAF